MKNNGSLMKMSKEELEQWKKVREEFNKEDKAGFVTFFTCLVSFTILLLFYAYFKSEIISLPDYWDIPFTFFGLAFVAYIGYMISNVLFDMKIQYMELRSRNIFKIITSLVAVLISTAAYMF